MVSNSGAFTNTARNSLPERDSAMYDTETTTPIYDRLMFEAIIRTNYPEEIS